MWHSTGDQDEAARDVFLLLLASHSVGDLFDALAFRRASAH
nr:hypothetical protein [Azonexus sp.]